MLVSVHLLLQPPRLVTFRLLTAARFVQLWPSGADQMKCSPVQLVPLHVSMRHELAEGARASTLVALMATLGLREGAAETATAPRKRARAAVNCILLRKEFQEIQISGSYLEVWDERDLSDLLLESEDDGSFRSDHLGRPVALYRFCSREGFGFILIIRSPLRHTVQQDSTLASCPSSLEYH